ncbi:MAG: alpha/beta hydrolase [Proteobacteria bacterium]|nr:alpha/beta hydrolase [Pseudomonadota bacterium]
MKRRRFKIVEGQLAKKLAVRYDTPFLKDASIDKAPVVSLESQSFTKEEKSQVQQSSYITKGGISYRVSSLKVCFHTSHHINEEVFHKRRSLVMINGLTRTKDHWVYFDRSLAKDLNVITLDPRGIGESRQKADWNLSIDHMSDDVKEVLDDLNVEKAYILGFSLGGMTALMFGLRYPRRVYSLVVINSSIGGGARSLRLYPKSILGLAGSLTKGGKSFHDSLSQYVLSLRTPVEMREWAANLWSNLEKRYGKGIMITFKQLVAASRFRNPHKLLAIKAPTLVLYGENDNFVASSHSAYIFSHLALAVLEGIENGGHELHFDKPFQLRDSVVRFISRDFSDYPQS